MMKKYLSFHLSYYDIDRNSPGSILTKMSIEDYQQLKTPLNCGFWILEKDFKNRCYKLKKNNEYFH